MAIQAHTLLNAAQGQPFMVDRDLQRFIDDDPDDMPSNHPWDIEAMARFSQQEQELDSAIESPSNVPIAERDFDPLCMEAALV